MSEAATLDPTRLVIAAIIGLALLLVLIIKFKVHAMISILLGAITIGVVAGMPLTEIVTAVNDGISNTLKGIALLVGLGSMFGAILEASGGAQTLKFMPTGGVSVKNLKDYLSCDKIICCGGSWMVKGDMIKSGEFDKIKQMTKEAVELAHSIRK